MNLLRYQDRIDRASDYLGDFFHQKPVWCVVLGSGLGGLGSHLQHPRQMIRYGEIPGFPQSSVHGHAGNLVFGLWKTVPVVVMEGRFHRYEGHDWKTLVLPVRVLIRTGVTHFFLTNAAGGIRDDLTPGDLMLIEDHINLMSGNSLTGPNIDSFGPRFPAMTGCYDSDICSTVKTLASADGLVLQTGVYAALDGPCYETPAEIRMLKALGADAVGMSTVPEVHAIRHAGCKCVAISMITNSTGTSHVPTHDEVMEMAGKKKQVLHQLVLNTITSPDLRKET